MESTVAQHWKGTFLYGGYRYRCDRLNRDGSMSLRCVRRDCAGRIKKLVDGTTDFITQHSHDVSQQENEESLSHEEYQYQPDNIDQNSLTSRKADIAVTNTHASQQGKVAWLYEGYHYRCDRINEDSSLSLQCIRHNCAGRIKKYIDGTTDYITPHSHESCTTVSQAGKENKASLLEGYRYQHDEIHEDSLMSLQEDSAIENTPVTCSGTVILQQRKETCLHEGYRYRCVSVNRDGSLSFRCVHRGCAGRVKKFVDGTTDCITPHSLESCTVVSQAGKEDEASLLEGCNYQHDKVHQDSLMSLQEDSVFENTPVTCSGTVVPQQRKETCLHEGYRYRRVSINRDGSLSFVCVHRGCAGRIKKFVDGTTDCITPHSLESCMVVSQAGKEDEAPLLEGYLYHHRDKVCQDSLMSLQEVTEIANTPVTCSGDVISQLGKETWLHEGYRYGRVSVNRDGSLSFRCMQRGCAGRIKKFLDGTTDYITPHSVESCTVVSQVGKDEASLLEGYHYQHAKVHQDSLMSLQEGRIVENTPATCSGTVISQLGKETWLHEGYRYRCVSVNRDGSLSFRCVLRGCAGRIKKLVDGTAITVTMHRHAVEVIKSETECTETDEHECDENVLLQTMMGNNFEFDLSLPSYSSSPQTVERKRKQDYTPDHETSSEIYSPGILEVIITKHF